MVAVALLPVPVKTTAVVVDGTFVTGEPLTRIVQFAGVRPPVKEKEVPLRFNVVAVTALTTRAPVAVTVLELPALSVAVAWTL